MKVIITGSTGMVGEGVMLVCLQHPSVEKVLVINRKPCGEQHPKLQEIIHADFYNLAAIEGQLQGYDACFFASVFHRWELRNLTITSLLTPLQCMWRKPSAA